MIFRATRVRPAVSIKSFDALQIADVDTHTSARPMTPIRAPPAPVQPRYRSADTAASAPSPTAVATCLSCVVRQSPAAKTPGIEVASRSSVRMKPASSFSASINSVFGTRPTYMKTPLTASRERSSVTTSRSTTPSTASFPAISSTTAFQTNSIFGFANALS